MQENEAVFGSAATHDEKVVISQLFSLGCTAVITSRSHVSGMVYSMQTSDLRSSIPEYVENHFRLHGQYPVGTHRFDLRSKNRCVYKFPDDPNILEALRNDYSTIAAWLALDWYQHGNISHFIRPEDSATLILRCPLRNQANIEAVATALTNIQNEFANAGSDQDYQRSIAVLPAAEATAIIDDATSVFHKAEGYPPNLTALWRQKHTRLPASLLRAIEAYATTVLNEENQHAT